MGSKRLAREEGPRDKTANRTLSLAHWASTSEVQLDYRLSTLAILILTPCFSPGSLETGVEKCLVLRNWGQAWGAGKALNCSGAQATSLYAALFAAFPFVEETLDQNPITAYRPQP